MKRHVAGGQEIKPFPAAFRRLCVETELETHRHRGLDPAAFRRLCVETSRRHRNR